MADGSNTTDREARFIALVDGLPEPEQRTISEHVEHIYRCAIAEERERYFFHRRPTVSDQTTVVDRLALRAAREIDPWSVGELSDQERDKWRRVVETILREALQIFLEQQCE